MKLSANVYAVIIAGGEGRRLWPLSNPETPKQFISVFDGKPLIRHAFERLAKLIPPERTLIITAEKFVALTRKALPEIPKTNIIGEPCRRDTAGAVAIACGLVKRLGGDDAVGCILASDHLIEPVSEFQQTLKDAIRAAKETDDIITVAIRPDRPATEYGYIECGNSVNIKTKTAFNRVLQFKEKPDKKTASRFLKAKRFLWNAGMFIWRADTLEKAFTTHAEDIGKIIQPLAQARNLKLTLKKLYPELRSISFDYAVMEKASNVLVARSSFQWSDVGSWQALAQHLPSDENGNTIIGDVTIDDTCSTTALSSPGHRIALAGLKDVIVIHSAKATLVISKKAAGNMKRIAEKALR